MIRSRAKFEKVSYEQFRKDCIKLFGVEEENITEELENNLKNDYDKIKLPKRSTEKSAGYDFYLPIAFSMLPSFCQCIPTGIRCVNMLDDEVLKIYPRSGLGTKKGFVPRNLVGIIDADYADSDNEGHIMMTMINLGADVITMNAGDAFCQGILQNFCITSDDNADGKRNGGFGSTDKKKWHYVRW